MLFNNTLTRYWFSIIRVRERVLFNNALLDLYWFNIIRVRERVLFNNALLDTGLI